MRIGGSILAIVAATFLAAPAAAQQTTPKIEVSAAYSYVRSNLLPDNGCCFGMNGGFGSITFNVNSWLGLTEELGGYHTGNVEGTGADLTVASYLFGPQFTLRRNKVLTPFTHVLLGAAHAGGSLYTGTASAAGLGAQTDFAMAMGGGLDANVNRHVAIRVFQADYFFTQFANGVNDHQNSLRISFGIVFQFGKR